MWVVTSCYSCSSSCMHFQHGNNVSPCNLMMVHQGNYKVSCKGKRMHHNRWCHAHASYKWLVSTVESDDKRGLPLHAC